MATTAELEKRVADLEAAVRRLQEVRLSEESKPADQGNNLWVKKVSGMFKDDPVYDEIARLGAEWRRSQPLAGDDLDSTDGDRLPS